MINDTPVSLESTGETFDDPAIVQAIATELGVNSSDRTVLTSDGDIELTIDSINEESHW